LRHGDAPPEIVDNSVRGAFPPQLDMLNVVTRESLRRESVTMIVQATVNK
jgi:hypothetical protein